MKTIPIILLSFIFLGVTTNNTISDNNIESCTYKIISHECRNTVSIENLIDNIKDKKIVYIGEFHDNPTHHRIQLDIIRRLYERNHRIAVGMEMFQTNFQDVINKYLEGTISKSEFLENTEYKKRWGFDFSLYEPIIDFIKEKELRLIALNVETEIIKKVSGGDISSFSSRELNKLPLYIDFTNKEYKKFLFGIYSEHPKFSQNNFSRFYNAQIVRDEVMAEQIYDFLVKNPDYQMVILAGNGHIMFSHGIPSRTYYRNNLEYVTMVSDLDYRRNIADYIINTDCKKEQEIEKTPGESEG